ncbi:MAG: type II secretion system F family protein [bacterium]|nr:type II secretion system F family protein [bacterium]
MVTDALPWRAHPETSARLQALELTLDRAGIYKRPEELALYVAIAAAAIWVGLLALVRPNPALAALLLLASAGASLGGAAWFVRAARARRLNAFVQQLELALRLIAGGVRVGLGLRQALTVVIEEMTDPARHEYMRIVGQTNIGMSVYDALDGLAERMPSNETLMMARAIRIQSQTGGDLGKILEHLADTIKERRRIQRKINAMTAEGRASALVLGLLPPILALFICLTQPSMGHALLFTGMGHVALGIVVVLEFLGVFTLLKILEVDV